jgi:hypothetical protein
MISAAVPVSSVCSAQPTALFAIVSIGRAIRAAESHWRAVGRSERSPRRIAQAYSSGPAIRNRTAAITNGGIVRTARSIPRYVEPQTT